MDSAISVDERINTLASKIASLEHDLEVSNIRLNTLNHSYIRNSENLDSLQRLKASNCGKDLYELFNDANNKLDFHFSEISKLNEYIKYLKLVIGPDENKEN